jgi:hypothetical protein
MVLRLLLAKDHVHSHQRRVLEEGVAMPEGLAGNDRPLDPTRKQHVVEKLEGVPGGPWLPLHQIQVLGEAENFVFRAAEGQAFKISVRAPKHRSLQMGRRGWFSTVASRSAYTDPHP